MLSDPNSDRKLKEYLRPWKLTTLVIGIGLLVWGKYYWQSPDWDIPISFIMAIATYLTAGWSMRVILFHQWRRLHEVLVYWWLSVDGLYVLYWGFVDQHALIMRDANFPASTALFFACGVLWAWNGTLKELVHVIHQSLKTALKPSTH